jgi:hypothetical protein
MRALGYDAGGVRCQTSCDAINDQIPLLSARNIVIRPLSLIQAPRKTSVSHRLSSYAFLIVVCNRQYRFCLVFFRSAGDIWDSLELVTNPILRVIVIYACQILLLSAGVVESRNLEYV